MRIHFPKSLNNENENVVNPPISTGYARLPVQARRFFAQRYKLAQEVGAKKNLNIQKYECVFHRHNYKVVIYCAFVCDFVFSVPWKKIALLLHDNFPDALFFLQTRRPVLSTVDYASLLCRSWSVQTHLVDERIDGQMDGRIQWNPGLSRKLSQDHRLMSNSSDKCIHIYLSWMFLGIT